MALWTPYRKSVKLCLAKTPMRLPIPQTLLLTTFLVILRSVAGGAPTTSQPELEPLYKSAEEAFQHQQWDRAQKLFGGVLVEAYQDRGRLRLLAGRFDLAVGDLERAHQLAPDKLAILGELG